MPLQNKTKLFATSGEWRGVTLAAGGGKLKGSRLALGQTEAQLKQNKVAVASSEVWLQNGRLSDLAAS